MSPYLIESCAGLLFGSLILGNFVLKKTESLLLATLFFYALCSGLMTYFVLPVYFPELGPHSRDMLLSSSLEACIWVIVIACSLLVVPSDRLRVLQRGFLLLGLADAIAIIVRASLGLEHSGIMLNPAQDAGFLVCLVSFLPRLIKRADQFIAATLMLVAILLTQSSTGILGIACVSSCLMFSGIKKHYKFNGIHVVLIVFAALITCGYLFLGPEFLNSNGRYNIWASSLEWWRSRCPAAIGSGLGTFFVYGPAREIQHLQGTAEIHPAFFWMHNDWLQILFELGIVGLALAISSFILLVYKSRHTPWLFSALVTFGVTAVIQMPLHQMPTAFLLALLARSAIEKSKVGDFQKRWV